MRINDDNLPIGSQIVALGTTVFGRTQNNSDSLYMCKCSEVFELLGPYNCCAARYDTKRAELKVQTPHYEAEALRVASISRGDDASQKMYKILWNGIHFLDHYYIMLALDDLHAQKLKKPISGTCTRKNFVSNEKLSPNSLTSQQRKIFANNNAYHSF